MLAREAPIASMSSAEEWVAALTVVPKSGMVSPAAAASAAGGGPGAPGDGACRKGLGGVEGMSRRRDGTPTIRSIISRVARESSAVDERVE